MTRTLMTPAEAAVYARVSRRTIFNWAAKGLIEYVRTPTGQMRVYVDSLLKDTHDALRESRSHNAITGRTGQDAADEGRKPA